MVSPNPRAMTGCNKHKKVKYGKQFATHCLFVTYRDNLQLGHQQCKKGHVFLSKPMHVQKYVVLKDLAPRVFPLLVSASSFLRIEDLNSCPPDLELDALYLNG